jgi:hypothetical protein
MPHASRTPAEAVERYRGQIVRLLSCVTSAHTTVSGYHASDLPHRLSLADGDPSLGWKLAWNFQPGLEVPSSARNYTPGESR